MRVALTSRLALSQPGGIEAVVRELLPRLQTENPDCTFVAVHAFGRRNRLNRLPLLGDLAAALLLFGKTLRADVVLVNGAEYAWPRMLSRRLRNKTIVVWHGTSLYEIPALLPRLSWPARIYAKLAASLQRGALSSPWHIAVGKHTVNEITHGYGFKGRVEMIPNGAPPATTDFSRQPIPGRIVWIGTNAYKKGLDLAIEAVALLRQRLPYVSLAVFGLERAQDEVPEWVGVHGLVAPQTLRDQAYRHADLLMATTRYECCSMAILEAMQYGVPIVASENIAWMFDDIMNAACLTPEDFARFAQILLTDVDRREKHLCAQTKALAAFDWAQSTRAYLRVIAAIP